MAGRTGSVPAAAPLCPAWIPSPSSLLSHLHPLLLVPLPSPPPFQILLYLRIFCPPGIDISTQSLVQRVLAAPSGVHLYALLNSCGRDAASWCSSNWCQTWDQFHTAGNDSSSSGTITPQEVPPSSVSSPETRLGEGEHATTPLANGQATEDAACKGGAGGAHAAWLSGRDKAEDLIMVAFRWAVQH